MYLYGVSSKFEFGSWVHFVVGPFSSKFSAEEWLSIEQYDFRERQIMSKSAAVALAGRKAVDNAMLESEYFCISGEEF